MKTMIALMALLLGSPVFAASLQWASLSPSKIQGELFVGALKTNAGTSQATLLPVCYYNAEPTDPWYKPSVTPLAIGWTSGGGSASALLGPVLDVGPQLLTGLEVAVGAFSPSAKASVTNFFTCAPTSTACGALSAGVLLNLNIEQGGKFSTTWKELGADPVAYFIGPSVHFAGQAVLMARK